MYFSASAALILGTAEQTETVPSTQYKENVTKEEREKIAHFLEENSLSSLLFV